MNGIWGLRGFNARAQSFDARAGVVFRGTELEEIGRTRRIWARPGGNSIERAMERGEEIVNSAPEWKTNGNTQHQSVLEIITSHFFFVGALTICSTSEGGMSPAPPRRRHHQASRPAAPAPAERAAPLARSQ